MAPDCSTVLILPKGDARHLVFPMVGEMKRRYSSRVIVLAKGKEEKAYFEKTGLADHVYCMSALACQDDVDEGDVIARARHIEEEFGVRMHDFMISMRLYYTASINFPSNGQIPYGNERKSYKYYLDWIIRQFDFYRKIIREHGVTLALNLPPVGYAAARAEGVTYRTFTPNLFQSGYTWFARDLAELPQLAEMYRASLESDEEAPELVLEQPREYLDLRASMLKNFSWGRVARNAAREVMRAYYYRWRGYDKATVFGFDGWRWSRYLLAQRVAFQKLRKLASIRLDDFRHKPFVFYPLSSEPEATLAFWSPEFYDQLSLIHAVAKNLPAGCFLAVKEHISCIGNRPKQFYETIAAMPNVILVDPLERGIDLVKASRAVATVASTAGFEAMVHGIPVLSFGAHTYYRVVPHVSVVSDFLAVRRALDQVLSYNDKDREGFRRCARHLLAVLSTMSLEYKDLLAMPADKRAAAVVDMLERSFGQEVACIPA